MKIERLDINDFGIISNQTLKDINSGIVVIGGLNRAGKTTMFQILRHLGYGFSKKNSLPSARNRYQVGADIRLDNGARYNISLDGYKEPKLNKLDNAIDKVEISCRDIYKNLDFFTYQQLFTISLDELQQVPQENSQQKRLQSILLGAGLSDIIEIQSISKNLKGKAENIGGKRGACNVYDFKPYNKQIRQGLKLRQEALQEIEIYQQTDKKIEEIEKRITDKEREISYLKAKITVLDILKNKFEIWQEKKELELKLKQYNEEILEQKCYSKETLRQAELLKDDYQAANNEYTEQLNKFKAEVVKEDIDIVQDKLLEVREQLSYFYEKSSGFKEKINNIIEQKKDNQQKKVRIIKKIQQQNNAWKDFDSILSIETDQIAEDNLSQLINQQKELNRKLKTAESSLQDLEEEKDRIEDKIDSITDISLVKAMNRYYFIGAGFIGLGLILLLMINNWVGIIIGLAGVIGSGLTYLTNYLAKSKSINYKQELELDLKEIISKISAKQESIQNLNRNLESLNEKIDKYRQLFDLPERCNPDLIKDTFRFLQDIKERIRDLRAKNKRLNTKKKRVKSELKELHKLINDISVYFYEDKVDWNEEAIIHTKDKLFTCLKEIYNFIELAVELNKAKIHKEELEVEVRELIPERDKQTDLESSLNVFIDKCKKAHKFKQLKKEIKRLRVNIISSLTTDRVKKAFVTLDEQDFRNGYDKQKLLTSFNSFFEQYTSLEDVTKDYEMEVNQLDLLIDELNELKNERQSLLDKKEELATSDKLKEAQQQIDQTRASLKPLAEKFAINKAAAFILDNVRERCINKVKEELLSPASNILRKLTENEYKKILPQNNLREVDFKLKSKNEDVQSTTDILSRGTKEQVFLSVRLSRIKEMEGSLPVILDDSLVNFDSYHLIQAVNILIELAKDHQVFVLTCHAELVKYISDQTDNVQYWKLDEGEFNLFNSSQQLINHLSV
ncbi:AAA family ATPase [Sporohalobacter salinus]|uniref:AAA family ATPase n=1 Tax=Sporohalobacter salinus TaxID=1494606 RepID=UPI00195FD00B|nr:uncharacterized protein YhaN [Sporohalobacter salinus]